MNIIHLTRYIAKKTPIIGPFVRAIRSSRKEDIAYNFSRNELPSNSKSRNLTQARNLLSYTKTSGSAYAGKIEPAGYHTIEINGERLLGQRDPEQRLALLNYDFSGKTVLDLGSNQGAMLHTLADRLSWGVGVDYDYRLVNCANRIAQIRKESDIRFYTFDLQKEPIELIEDFLPGSKVDVVFLLSVCMWLNNWRNVIDFASRISDQMFFESNGSKEQQEEQIGYLNIKYRAVEILSHTSDDDNGQKNRKAIWCVR